MNRIAHRVRDGVANTERLNHERPNLDLITRIKWAQRIRRDLVLLQLVGQESAREGARIDRDAREFRQDVRQRTNVILVSVCDQDRLDRALPFAEIRDIGNDDVYAERGLIREGESAVDQDDRLLILVEVEVLSDLTHPAERNQAERRSTRSRSIGTSPDCRTLTCGTRGCCSARLRPPLAPPSAPSLTLRACRWTLTPLIH